MTRIPKFLSILYSFGRSDIPAATLPSMAIAIVLAGPVSLQLLAKGFLWNQIHLLTFQVKNQINGIEEDRIAKPHRPLPSGDISLKEANKLYYGLFALMWVGGFYTRTLACTLTYSVAIVIYNEGGLAAIPVVKNVIGAIGLACYCWGTTITLGMVAIYFVEWVRTRRTADMLQDQGRELYGMKAVAVLMIGFTFATTVSLASPLVRLSI
ncbi:MAG: hypothetical protein Q9192_007668 [Flavoplaca navasiana]